jgi:hypothetical protein
MAFFGHEALSLTAIDDLLAFTQFRVSNGCFAAIFAATCDARSWPSPDFTERRRRAIGYDSDAVDRRP